MSLPFRRRVRATISAALAAPLILWRAILTTGRKNPGRRSRFGFSNERMETIRRWRWRLLAIILLGGVALLIEKWRAIRENSQDPVILEAAAHYGVDPALVKAVVWRESWFNPRARGRKGEIGLMQIREKTAQEWAAEEHIHLITHFQMLDPVKNARAGTWYLRKLLRRALADYNAGRARVLQWSNSGAAATNSAAFLARMDYPGTRRYVQSVMKRYQHYRPIFPPKNKRLELLSHPGRGSDTSVTIVNPS